MIKKIADSYKLWGEVNSLKKFSSTPSYIELFYLSIIAILEILYLHHSYTIFLLIFILLLNTVISLNRMQCNKLLLDEADGNICIFIYKIFIVFLLRLMIICPIMYLLYNMRNYNMGKIILIIWLITSIIWLMEFISSFLLQKNVGFFRVLLMYIIIFSFSYLKLWLVIISYLGYNLIDWLASKKSLYYFYKMSKPLEEPKPVKFDVDSEMELFWENKKAEVLFIVIAINITAAIRENISTYIKSCIYKILSYDKINITIVTSLLTFIVVISIYLLIKIMLKYKKVSDKIPFFSSVISQQKAWANSKQIKEDKSNKSEE